MAVITSPLKPQLTALHVICIQSAISRASFQPSHKKPHHRSALVSLLNFPEFSQDRVDIFKGFINLVPDLGASENNFPGDKYK